MKKWVEEGGAAENRMGSRAVKGIDVPHAIYTTLNYPTAVWRQQLFKRWRREKEAVQETSRRRWCLWGWRGSGREGASCFSSIYLHCRLWWQALGCNANSLSCLTPEDTKQDCRRKRNRQAEVGRQRQDRMEIKRGWESKRKERRAVEKMKKTTERKRKPIP